MSVARARQHSIGDLPRRTAARLPDKPAICLRRDAWTYREFDAICNRLAAGLLARGLSAGDRVAVLARNSHAFAALRFALARIGAVLVPINFMLNAEEVAYILRHAGASMLAVDDGLADTGARAPRRSTPQVTHCSGCRREAVGAGGRPAAFDDAADSRDAARACDRRQRPGADRLHQRHRIAAQGRDAHARRGDLAVRELHRRRRHRRPTT